MLSIQRFNQKFSGLAKEKSKLTSRLKIELKTAITRPDRMGMRIDQSRYETAASAIDLAFAFVLAPGGHLIVIVHMLDVAFVREEKLLGQ